MDYISYLMKLFNKFEAKKIGFDGILTKVAAMKIQDGALVTSCDVTVDVW